jgi:hypothetical protein
LLELALRDEACHDHRVTPQRRGIGVGFLGRRLLAVATLLAMIAVGWVAWTIGNAAGMPFEQTMPLGLILVGVTVLSLHRVYSYSDAMSPFVVASIVMLLFAALGAINTGKEAWPQANAFLLFAGVVAVEVTAFLLLSGVLAALTRGIVRGRRSKERRDLAASRGWQFGSSDPDLPSALGSTDHYVAHLPDSLFTLGQRPVPSGARAHAIIRGQVNGVDFVTFDYVIPGERPLVITTAWLVRLPHALPFFASAEMYRNDLKAQSETLAGLVIAEASSQAGHDTTATPNPDYANAVMTPDVVRFTREHFPSWWVDGTVLASTARSNHGAPPELLTRNVEAIAWLATVLTSPAIARYAIGAAGTHESHPA